MKQRTITGVVLVAIFLPLLIVSELFSLFQILMMALVLVASYEMIKLYETEKAFPGVSKFIIVLCSELIYLSALAEWSPSYLAAEGLNLFNINIGFLPMLLIVLLIFFSFLVMYDDFNAADVGKALTIVTYVGLGFAALTNLRYIGLRFIVYLFLITTATDVFAYLFGMKFGKHKMSPKISPKKSWEGAIAGTVMATILGSVFAFFYGSLFGNVFGPEVFPTLFHQLLPMEKISIPFQVIIIIGISAFVSMSGQIGDLVASKLKRSYQIKDFGRIFPGHGGVLDRLDSALFGALFLLSIFTCLLNFFATGIVI